MASGNKPQDHELKKSSSAIEQDRRNRFLVIRGCLEEIRDCLDNWRTAPKFFQEDRIPHLIRIIETKVHEENNHILEMEDGFINRTMPFGAEIIRHGKTDYAIKLFKELHATYKKLYHEERKREFNKRTSSPIKEGRFLQQVISVYMLRKLGKDAELMRGMDNLGNYARYGNEYLFSTPPIWKKVKPYEDWAYKRVVTDFQKEIAKAVKELITDLKEIHSSPKTRAFALLKRLKETHPYLKDPLETVEISLMYGEGVDTIAELIIRLEE